MYRLSSEDLLTCTGTLYFLRLSNKSIEILGKVERNVEGIVREEVEEKGREEKGRREGKKGREEKEGTGRKGNEKKGEQ